MYALPCWAGRRTRQRHLRRDAAQPMLADTSGGGMAGNS